VTGDDWRDRFLAVREANERGDREFLIGALLDPDHRSRAAKFLGELKAAEATRPLLRMLDARDPHARAAAATALGQIGALGARSRLRELVGEDDDAMVRSWAVAALGEIGHPDDVAFLVPRLEDPSLRVRGAAALALGNLGDPEALGVLRRARRRLRRAPHEWYLHRKVYNRAIRALRRARAAL
jgi:HEAT repeat protein